MSQRRPAKSASGAPGCFCPPASGEILAWPLRTAPTLKRADRANALSTERSGFITSGSTTGQMAWQIPTLAIGSRVGARVQAKNMGSKAPADCGRRDTIWHHARVPDERVLPSVYLLTLRSLPRRKATAGGSGNGAARAEATAAGTATAPYPVYHRADPAHWAKRAAGPVHRAKRSADPANGYRLYFAWNHEGSHDVSGRFGSTLATGIRGRSDIE